MSTLKINHITPYSGDTVYIDGILSSSTITDLSSSIDSSILGLSSSLDASILGLSSSIADEHYSHLNSSNQFNGNQTITGSLYVSQNLIVQGSSSISYISQSTLNIGTNLITVNAQAGTSRFGGLAVIDSGSAPQVSGSILFDSQENQWLFVHQNQSIVTSSLLIMGPETYNSVGNEIHPTTNRIMKSINDEHIGDSNISDNGSVVSINSNTQITGSLVVSDGITGTATTASYVLNAVSASYATNAATATTASYVLNAVSASYATNAATATTASYVLNVVSASYSLSSSYSRTSTSASYATNATNATTATTATSASYATNATTASYALSSSYSRTSTSASYAINATNSNTADTATSASYALSSSYSRTSTTASYATTALSASYAPGAGAITYYIDSSTTSSTIANTSFTIIPTISITPSAGTYLVHFTGDFQSSANNGDWIDVTLYYGSTEQTASRVRSQNFATHAFRGSISTQFIITVNGSTVVAPYYRTNASGEGASSFTIYNRVLTAIKIA